MTGHSERAWIPSDFVDEDGPAPRAHPTDWLVPLEGGGVGLDRRWAGDAPQPLADGDRVDFDWIIGDLGEREVKIVVEAGGRRVVVDPPPPEAPPGTRLLVWIPFDPNTLSESVEELTSEWGEWESGFVRFFVWNEKAVPFLVRGGRFARATPFRSGDTVVHLPSGETWTVAFDDGERLARAGWADDRAHSIDCEEASRCSDDEHRAWVNAWERYVESDDRRHSVLRLYRPDALKGGADD